MDEQLPLTPARRFSRPPSGAEALLVADDVAAWLGVTVAWVFTEASTDWIPHVRVGLYSRYRPSSIEAWLRSRSIDDDGEALLRDRSR